MSAHKNHMQKENLHVSKFFKDKLGKVKPPQKFTQVEVFGR